MSKLNSAGPKDMTSLTTLERRAWVRFPSTQTTLCQEKTAQTYDLWFMAKILDISPNGMRLLLGHAFDLGSVVAIEPIRTTQPIGRSLHARIIYCNEEKRGLWVIGCEFTSPLAEQEIEALTEPESNGPAEDS
jgi:hypothetical protein